MDKQFTLGVTGGIASGKSTVSAMLEKLGAPLIDFDRLARQVVEPGQPALVAIREYFGTNVLHADGSLDRKKLSGIVFNDPEKRKKLEHFTHTAIFEVYLRQVDALAAPGTLIQAAVPLLYELNMQSLFDKVLVVYVAPAKQEERLAMRDGITREAAATIMQSQLPIDEKAGQADYIIDNGGTLDKTLAQVAALWEKLQRIVTF